MWIVNAESGGALDGVIGPVGLALRVLTDAVCISRAGPWAMATGR